MSHTSIELIRCLIFEMNYRIVGLQIPCARDRFVCLSYTRMKISWKDLTNNPLDNIDLVKWKLLEKSERPGKLGKFNIYQTGNVLWLNTSVSKKKNYAHFPNWLSFLLHIKSFIVARSTRDIPQTFHDKI